MKNILALLDQSAGAERIANLALKIAHQVNANLLLCNAIDVPAKGPLVFTSHDEAYWAPDETSFSSAEELAWRMKHRYNMVSKARINCLHTSNFNPDKIEQLIIDNQVSMIIIGTDDLFDLNTSGALQMINKANCPVLVIPENSNFNTIDSTAYLTDLRYCDINVVRFLKNFNAKIYITHLSLSGIPDMEDSYAQNLLSDTVATEINYNKLFLRNIKGTNRKTDLETVTATAGIGLYTIVNKKHQLLERFLSGGKEMRRAYHNLPLLIMPYLNWHMA